jgi:hypothetical protein
VQVSSLTLRMRNIGGGILLISLCAVEVLVFLGFPKAADDWTVVTANQYTFFFFFFVRTPAPLGFGSVVWGERAPCPVRVLTKASWGGSQGYGVHEAVSRRL